MNRAHLTGNDRPKIGSQWTCVTSKDVWTLVDDDETRLPFRMVTKDGRLEWSCLQDDIWQSVEHRLSDKVASLEAELAELKAAKKPAYDYAESRGGDLFRHKSGSIYMALTSFYTPLSLVQIAGSARNGNYWVQDRGFDGDENAFKYLGNMNDNPDLLKETLA